MLILPSHVSAICRVKWWMFLLGGVWPFHLAVVPTIPCCSPPRWQATAVTLPYPCTVFLMEGTTPFSLCLYQKVEVQNKKAHKRLHVLMKMRPNPFCLGSEELLTQFLSFCFLAWSLLTFEPAVSLADMEEMSFFKFILPGFGPILCKWRSAICFWKWRFIELWALVQDLLEISFPGAFQRQEPLLPVTLSALSPMGGSPILQAFYHILNKHSEAGFKHRLWEHVFLWVPPSSFYAELDP